MLQGCGSHLSDNIHKQNKSLPVGCHEKNDKTMPIINGTGCGLELSSSVESLTLESCFLIIF